MKGWQKRSVQNLGTSQAFAHSDNTVIELLTDTFPAHPGW